MKTKRIAMACFTAMLMFTCFMGQAVAANIYDDDRGDKEELTDSEKYALKEPGKRASGKGVSFKATSARQLARLDARANFAEALSAAITSAAEEIMAEEQQFVANNVEGRELDEARSDQNTLAKSVAKQVVENTVEVKMDKYYNKRTRRYTVYVCLEYRGEVQELAKKAATEYRDALPADTRSRLNAKMAAFEEKVEKQLKEQQGGTGDEEAEE